MKSFIRSFIRSFIGFRVQETEPPGAPLASLGDVLLALTRTGAPGPAARGEQGDGERGRAAARRGRV